MPKIMPDELAEAVKAAGVPVSAICQRPLSTVVDHWCDESWCPWRHRR